MSRLLQKAMGVFLVVIIAFFSLTACNTTGTNTTNKPSVTPDERDGDVEKDGEFITEDEKWSRIAEGMLGANGSFVKEYDGYLGYGYNLITSAYYNHKDINDAHPVVDMNTLAANTNKVYVQNQNANFSEPTTFICESTKEYARRISAKAGVRGDYPLSGSFEANFEFNSDYQMKSNQRLVTLQSNLETRKDYIMGNNANLLAQYLTEEFIEDVKALSTDSNDISVMKFVEKYGTHVLVNVTMGGRFDLNYLYTNKSSKSMTEIDASLRASYRYISGSASESDKTTKSEIESNSELHVKTYGGTVTVDPKSVGAAIDSYKKWSQGVQDGMVSFIDASEVIPIWDVIEEAYKIAKEKGTESEKYEGKSEAVNNYIEKFKEEMGKKFKDTIGVEIPKTYISDLYVGIGSSETEAKNKLRNNGVREENIVDIDLNKDAGGYYIYLGYKTTTNKNNAITLITADYFKSSRNKDATYNGYTMTIIPADLNLGNKGKYTYLYYTKESKAGAPITEIIYQVDGKIEGGRKNVNGYSAVRCMYDEEPMDFNKGAEGAFIYLWFKRG